MKHAFLILAIGATAFVSCNNSGNNATTTDSTGTMGTDTGMATGTTSAATAAPLNDTDREFAMKAASGGMMEVAAGRLAEQKASSARVKSFGTMMVQDHTNAGNELKGIASSKNIMLPDSMMAEHKKHVDDLSKKSGKAFDKAYMQMMVDDHQKDVSDFQAASNNAQDAEIKGFAGKTLPTLRMHLDSARAINGGLK